MFPLALSTVRAWVRGDVSILSVSDDLDADHQPGDSLLQGNWQGIFSREENFDSGNRIHAGDLNLTRELAEKLQGICFRIRLANLVLNAVTSSKNMSQLPNVSMNPFHRW